MSFIQSTIKCQNCDYEMNVAEGTFGYGIPKECPECGSSAGRAGFPEPFYEVIASGWHAKGSKLAFFCTRTGCDHKDC